MPFDSHVFFFLLVNNQQKLTRILNYSYRKDSLSVFMEVIFFSQSITMLNNVRRIFFFDENSLNSSSSDTTSTSSTTITNTSAPSNYDSHGIYDDHPGLNPSSERIVELQSEIHDKLRELLPNMSEQEVLAAAEALHGESDNLAFMEDILEDLNKNGIASEAYKDAIHLTDLATSPLDQFEIIPLIDMKIGDLYFSFTNPSLFMLLTLSLVLLLFHFVTKNGGGKLVPNAWQSLVELIYDFVPNLVNEQIGGLSGNVKQQFFPCIFVTFTFLLFCNLQGMIPYSFTVTSHFLITLGLSFSIFIGITIVGFQRNGLHFLSFSLPAGVPLPLAPFLVLLELIPHCFRALSSGIRLFANMMAGHSSVKILSGSAWTMLCMNDLFYFIGDLGPLFIVLALTGPELGVAISQAHVSTISICIYLNDAINLHQTG